MSIDDDLLQHALADLATRADADQPLDRIPRVHRRARRNAVVRAAVPVAGVALLVALGGTAFALRGSDGDRSLPAGPTPSVTFSSPTPAATTIPTTAGPTPSAPASVAPSATTSPAAVVDWRDRSYPVDCGDWTGTLRFRDGEARHGQFGLEAEPSRHLIDGAGGELAVESVVLHCVGADSGPDSVLVYRADGDHALLGTVVKASANTQVRTVTVSGGALVVTAKGWSASAPHSDPDLVITTRVTSAGDGIAVTRHTDQVQQPHLDVTLELASAPGAADVRVVQDASGLIPQLYDAESGALIPAKSVDTLGTELDWGDGSDKEGSDGGAVRCRAGAPLAPFHQSNAVEHSHTYAKPGTYTVTFTDWACPPVGGVTKTLTVTVR